MLLTIADNATIVDTLRRMTGATTTEYTIDDATYWTDTQLARILESRVTTQLVQAPVQFVSSIDDQGHIVFKHGQVTVPGTLDTDTATLVDITGQPIEPASISDDGRIEFNTDQSSAVPLLSGNAYDLHGAAADVLTVWAAAVKLGYDISTDGQSMNRSQRHRMLLDQADTHRAQAVPGRVRLARSDIRRRGNTRTGTVERAFRCWGTR